MTVQESIVVSAVFSQMKYKSTYTRAAAQEYTEKIMHSLRRTDCDVDASIVVNRVCAALSHMGLLESTCTDK